MSSSWFESRKVGIEAELFVESDGGEEVCDFIEGEDGGEDMGEVKVGDVDCLPTFAAFYYSKHKLKKMDKERQKKKKEKRKKFTVGSFAGASVLSKGRIITKQKE
jgi:hypothetical protein